MVYEGKIKGKTVMLRSVEERDAEITFKMRSDPEKSRFIHAAKGTVEDQLNFIKKQRQKEGDYLFLIEDLEGNPIGMKGLTDFDPEAKEIESGRFIGFGNQIQNMEALILSCDFAFETLDVTKINMAALENNTAMLGIQQKLGVVFTDKVPVEGFEVKNQCSYLTKENYAKSRPAIVKLIDRFASRGA